MLDADGAKRSESSGQSATGGVTDVFCLFSAV